MKLLKIMAIAASAMFASASAQAGVVLSNLGASGSDASLVGATSTNQNGANRNAVGFQVGATNATLDKVTLALFQAAPPATVNTTVSLFADSAGVPGTFIATSNATGVSDSNPAGGPKALFDFTFTGVTLSANTKYWVTPDIGGGSFAWYLTSSFAPAAPVGGSDYTYLGAATNTGSGWTAGGPPHSFALFTTGASPAVPEPALTSLLCLGGVALIRRRMKK